MRKLMLIAAFILTLFSTNAELKSHGERSLRRLLSRKLRVRKRSTDACCC